MTLGLRTRLTLLFVLQVVVILVAAGVYLSWELRNVLEQELGQKLEALAQAVAVQLEPEMLLALSPGDETRRTYRSLHARLQQLTAALRVRRIFVFDRQQRSLVDSHPGTPIGRTYVRLQFDQKELQRVFAGLPSSSPLFQGDDGRLYKNGYAPIRAGSRIVAGIGVEASAANLAVINRVRQRLYLLGAAAVAAAILLGVLFSRQITRPLERLKRAASNIAEGQLQEPVPVSGRDEIGFLGKTMEEMRQAILHRDARQKAMVAGVAHEIRNPLGGIELFAGLLADEVENHEAKEQAEKIRREVRQLNRIVQSFLEYARPPAPQPKPCRVAEVVEEAKLSLGDACGDERIDHRSVGSQLRVLADPQHLRQILVNLIRNALEVSEAGERVVIEAREMATKVQVAVCDSGPGITPDVAEHVFDPFFTTKESGTGLGLAIVKSLVEANGGRVWFEPNQPQGARFVLELGKASDF